MNGDAPLGKGLERATDLIQLARGKFEIDSQKLDWEHAEKYWVAGLLKRNECRVLWLVPYKSKHHINCAPRSKRGVHFHSVVEAFGGEWCFGRVRITVSRFLSRPPLVHEFEVPFLLPNFPIVIVRSLGLGEEKK